MQYLASGLALGSVYALVAMAFNIIFATSKVINFATGDFVMVGALVILSFVKLLQVPIWEAVVLGIVVCASMGYLTELLGVRPIRNFPLNIGWVMSTLGISIVLRNAAAQIWGKEPLPFPSPFGGGTFSWGGMTLLSQEVAMIVMAIAIMVLFDLFLNRTIIGKAIKAVAFDPEAAKLMGINVGFIVSLSFALGGMLAASGGFLVAPVTFADPSLGYILGIKGFSAAAVGGLGSARGAILGGFILGIVEVFAGGFLWTGAKDITAFVLLISVMLLAPNGLMGARVLQKV